MNRHNARELALHLIFAGEYSGMSGEELLQVNYMYSITPEFPLLALFYQVIPAEYWYMYMVVPIVAVYLLLVYAPQLLRRRAK